MRDKPNFNFLDFRESIVLSACKYTARRIRTASTGRRYGSGFLRLCEAFSDLVGTVALMYGSRPGCFGVHGFLGTIPLHGFVMVCVLGRSGWDVTIGLVVAGYTWNAKLVEATQWTQRLFTCVPAVERYCFESAHLSASHLFC